MLNIVIPMAGRGSRFENVGFTEPKPLIPVFGQAMIKLVIDNLKPKNCEFQFIFICRQDTLENYSIAEKLETWAPGSKIIPVNQITDGAACTVLLAEKYINNDFPLMIANCDQWIDIDINLYLEKIMHSNLDGLIMTMKANHEKWSFIRLDPQNNITEVVEKKVVSDEATVGIYNFKRGSDFVKAAYRMIDKNLRVNGEFYVAPTYNELINEGAKLGYFNIGSEARGMYGLGTPEDLAKFIQNEKLRERLTI